MAWTRFMDMHSGGGQKETFAYLYIEVPQKEAEIIFQNRFGHNPNRITCTCCGKDYSISEHNTLEDATGYNRGCRYGYVTPGGIVKTTNDWHKATLDERQSWKGQYLEEPEGNGSFHPYMPLTEYLASHNDVMVISATDIKPEERVGKLRTEGFVWID